MQSGIVVVSNPRVLFLILCLLQIMILTCCFPLIDCYNWNTRKKVATIYSYADRKTHKILNMHLPCKIHEQAYAKSLQLVVCPAAVVLWTDRRDDESQRDWGSTAAREWPSRLGALCCTLHESQRIGWESDGNECTSC